MRTVPNDVVERDLEPNSELRRLREEVDRLQQENHRLRAAPARESSLGFELSALERIVECVPDGIEITDTNKTILYVNPAFEQMTGYSLAEARGKTVAQLVRSNYHDVSYFQAISDVIAQGKVWRGQLVSKHKDGNLVFQAATIAPVQDAAGNITHYIAIKRDKGHELETERARDAALELARARSEFAANVSHELRTPLNGIHSALHLLVASELDADQTELVRIACESSNLLLRLINDVLDFSRLQSGKLELEQRSFDLVQLVGDVIGIARLQAEAKGLALSQTIDPSCPNWVTADPHRLKQVLLNLLGNAIKFTPAGEIGLTVSALPDTLRFRVSDSGIGVPLSARSRIFEPFEQVDASTTRQYGGSGLGLAICRQIIQAMGGEIAVDDNPTGLGSVFSFQVPLIVTDHPVQPAGASEATTFPDMNVLVAEDNEIIRMILRRLFEKLGCTLTVVEDGEQAVAAVQREAYSVVFLDCQMPGMDGMEATACIRAMPAPIGAVPIVALTAQAMEGDREKFLSIGMDDYISKPFTPTDIERVLRRFRLPVQPPSHSAPLQAATE